jgi:polysaccharide pyruvyl transferase WcaK-like protein
MRVLISGYYGFGNLGDEALLEVIVGRLRAIFPQLEIEVLSATPQMTAAALAVEAAPRWNWRAVRGAIARADIVLSGGGGLLQSATSIRSLLYYAGILREAIRAKRKTMIFAQSIGPLDRLGELIVRGFCKGLDRATVRDERSCEVLRALVPRVRKVSGFRDGVGVVARAVDRLAERHGIRTAFLPLGGAADAEVSTDIIRACASTPVLLPECSLAKAAAILRGARVVVGMRLHALILAARYAVPFLAIPYDPKVEALCEDLQYPLPPLWKPGTPRPSAGEIDGLVDSLVERRDPLAEHLAERIATVRASAQRNFEVLGELLRE